jgi:hypothetical protein
MGMEIQEKGTETANRDIVRYRGAIWTLLILSPVIAEVLNGATRLSTLFVFVPEVLVWGAGALLCRELVRRWRAGWMSLAALGLALSVAEEIVIQQTSLAPLPFPGANAAFGRWGGVNWVYFLFMLGYECVWVVLVPVKVTELIFPRKANSPWLRRRGLIVTTVAFLVGCRIAWYAWTQRAVPMVFHIKAYVPTWGQLAAGLAGIVALIGLAWVLRGVGPKTVKRRIVQPWAAGAMAAVAAAVWFVLLGQNFQTHPQLTAVQTVLCQIALAVVIFALFAVWTGSTEWSARHEWAVCFGVVLTTGVGSSLNKAGYSVADFIFKNAVDVLVLIGLAWLGVQVWKRRRAESIPEVSTGPK